MSTVFTKIMDGQFPGLFAWSDAQCAVFASINPITDGHLLVVPRVEVPKFTAADDALLSHLFWVAKRVGQACELAFDAPRAALLVAGFEVPHLHLHVLPAWGEAELSFANAAPSVPTEVLEANVTKVRIALSQLGYGAHVPKDIHNGHC